MPKLTMPKLVPFVPKTRDELLHESGYKTIAGSKLASKNIEILFTGDKVSKDPEIHNRYYFKKNDEVMILPKKAEPITMGLGNLARAKLNPGKWIKVK